MTSFTTNTFEKSSLFQNWNSIRIPRISKSYSEYAISQMFHGLGLGRVERVDFVAIPNQEVLPFHTAYVHMASWYSTKFTQDVRFSVDSTGSYRMNFYDGTYCFFQRMTCEPVPTTYQNIHQLAAALTAMEARLRATEELLAAKSTEHADTIDQLGEQASQIANLERRLDEYDEYYENEANEYNAETFDEKASRIPDLDRRLEEYCENDANEYNEADANDSRYSFRVTRTMSSEDLEEGDVDEAGFHSSYYTSDPDISRMTLDELAALVQDPDQAFDCGSPMDISVDESDDGSLPDLIPADSDSDSVESADSERMRTTQYLCDNY